MSKHTPGPWQMTSGQDYPGIWCVEAEGKYLGFLGSATLSEEESEANARLCAAAPALLAACEAMENLLAQTSDPYPDEVIALKLAQDAIRKAKGESDGTGA